MAAAKSLVSVLPLLCLVFLSVQSSHLADAHGLSYINKICQRATRFNPAINLNFCVTSLQTVPESYTTKIPGLLKITTDLALQNALRTSGLIKKMNSVACEDLSKEQLNTCLIAYSSAVSALQETAQAFAANKYDDGAELGTVLDEAAQCDKAFEKGNGSLLADENSNLCQLVTIAQALCRFAIKTQPLTI